MSNSLQSLWSQVTCLLIQIAGRFLFEKDGYHEVQKYSQNSLQHPDTAEVSDRKQPHLLSNVRMGTFLETQCSARCCM